MTCAEGIRKASALLLVSGGTGSLGQETSENGGEISKNKKSDQGVNSVCPISQPWFSIN
jgi:hypothetical protein